MNDPSDLEEHIFAEALIVPPAERARYLDNACRGNPALRERVEALLLAHESAGLFMASQREPSLGGRSAASTASDTSDRAGQRIGRYKLLQKLGEGGCGVVWMAEQEHPVRRRVALKVIKLGMDTKNVIARFEAERQALAMMDHPHIARVLEAGATDTGRPYFVMELVPGVPITKYCDQHNLSTAARLGLFAQVCHAVQHAHHKGVVHRDLKPSNILVTLHDGVPVPKVIDFGIAKATQGRLTDHTLFTAFEQFIGTPAYMSPEQAEMSGIDIDTRSDIYSLGVLLYELLTGRPPFDPKSLLQAGLDEIRRIIREVEPLKPSTRLNTLADSDRDSIARQRGTAPTQLSVLLRGDLDWIVMKALEKNRNRRYDTASGLAMDIQRHLQNEPVSARPPTASYRISRLIRRNRVAVIAVSAVLLALAAGTVVSTLLATRARRAERAAEAERKTAVEERSRAEDLLGFMIGDLRTQLATVGRLDVLESASDKAMAYFSSRDPGTLDDSTLARHARSLTQVGEIRMDQARYEPATAAFAEAYDRASALVTRHPENGDMLFERAQAEYWNGFVQWKQGNLAQAADWFNRYRDTSVALAAIDPTQSTWQSELAWGQHNLAVVHRDRGDLGAAEAGFGAELAVLERLQAASPGDLDLRYRIADVHSWLGGLAEQQGRFAEAEKRYVAQTSQLEALVQAAPGTAQWRFKLADSLLFQTKLALTRGQINKAAEKLLQARRLLTDLAILDPTNRVWEIAKLNAGLDEALVARKQGNLPVAERIVKESLPPLESLAASEKSDRSFAGWLAKAWRMEAQNQLAAGQPGAATSAQRAIDLGAALIREGRGDSFVGEYALACVVAGETAAQAGATANARSHWQRAIEVLTPHLPGTRDWRLLDPAARALFRLGRAAEAQTIVDQLTALGYEPLDAWPELVNAPRQEP